MPASSPSNIFSEAACFLDAGKGRAGCTQIELAVVVLVLVALVAALVVLVAFCSSC